MEKNYAPFTISVTEARTELVHSIDKSNNQTIALIHQSKIKAYIVPAKLYEEMVDKLKSFESK